MKTSKEGAAVVDVLPDEDADDDGSGHQENAADFPAWKKRTLGLGPML
jgi:hypothetical protein